MLSFQKGQLKTPLKSDNMISFRNFKSNDIPAKLKTSPTKKLLITGKPLQTILAINRNISNQYVTKTINYIYDRFYLKHETSFFISLEVLAQEISSPISETLNALYFLENERLIKMSNGVVINIKKPTCFF